jgi:hypothetical protein
MTVPIADRSVNEVFLGSKTCHTIAPCRFSSVFTQVLVPMCRLHLSSKDIRQTTIQWCEAADREQVARADTACNVGLLEICPDGLLKCGDNRSWEADEICRWDVFDTKRTLTVECAEEQGGP